MTIQIITLFPEMFEGVLNSSMLWKAQKTDLIKYELINLRDFGIGPRKQVDDIPYGGGDGMVTMDNSLMARVKDGTIEPKEAYMKAAIKAIKALKIRAANVAA